jgi:nucleotide-binding universal stress UspA family protein
MADLIVPIGETDDAREAAERALELWRRDRGKIHLLAVRQRLPRHVSQFLSRNDLDAFYRESGLRVLEPAMRRLDAAGVAHEEHVLTGPKAETIVSFAARFPGSRLVLDERQGLLSAIGLGSISDQVRHLLRTRSMPTVAADAANPT